MPLMYVCDDCGNRQYIPSPCEVCNSRCMDLEDATPEATPFGYARGCEVLAEMKREQTRRHFMTVKIYMAVCVSIIIGGLLYALVLS